VTLMAGLLSLLLLAMAVACGEDDSTGESSSPTAPAGELTPLPPAPRAEGVLDQPVVLEDTSVLLSNLQDPFPLEDPALPVAEDERLIALDAEIVNVGAAGEFTYASFYFSAIDSQAQKVYVPSEGFETTLGSGILAAEGTASGRIVFLVPVTAVIDTVRYKPFEERDIILISLSE
jgi:hypothetical protein